MTQDNSADVPDGAFPLVLSPEICADVGIGERGLRKRVLSGKFPRADGNLDGRNFWYRSTYRRWQADVLAGRYHNPRELNLGESNLGESNLVRAPVAKGRAPNPRRPAREPQTA